MLEFIESKIEEFRYIQRDSLRLGIINETMDGALSMLRIIKSHIKEGDPYKRVKTIKQKKGKDTVIEVDGETYILRHKDQR